MARLVQDRSVKTRESILLAAEALVGRASAGRLTIDAVASEAGVSKGAVLHHFRSKDALVAGMVSRQLDAIRAGRIAEAERLPEQPNRALLAVLSQSARRFHDQAGYPSSLMIASLENSQSLAEVKAFGDDSVELIRADSSSPEEAIVLNYAALGVLLARTLGFATLDPEDGMRLFDTMMRMARRL